MSNVVLLVPREARAIALDGDSGLDAAVMQVLSCSAGLEDRLQVLCAHLDALDRLILHIEDVGLRRVLRAQTRNRRQALVKAKQELWTEMYNLPSLRRATAELQSRGPSVG